MTASSTTSAILPRPLACWPGSPSSSKWIRSTNSCSTAMPMSIALQEQNYWFDQLDQGNISLAQLAVEVALGAQGEDIVVYLQQDSQRQ
jgi:hypothetical protein